VLILPMLLEAFSTTEPENRLALMGLRPELKLSRPNGTQSHHGRFSHKHQSPYRPSPSPEMTTPACKAVSRAGHYFHGDYADLWYL
jgi:hypothetical protein